MNEENVAFRLKVFIDDSGLTHSQFADRCGIPRPSLSQIISGRNKKVSDIIIGQIHNAFPNLSVVWLLFGEGPMLINSGGASSDAAGQSGQDFPQNAGRQFSSHPSGGNDSLNGSDSLFGNGNFGSEIPEYNATSQAQSIRPNVRALNNANIDSQVVDKKLFEESKATSDLKREIEKLRKNPRKVSHITIYYDDSTFETFYPKR